MSKEEVLSLLMERIAAVLVIDAGEVRPDARFEDDLQADSLDVVEIIEGMEQELRGRGFTVSVSDEELVDLVTVEAAADCLHGKLG